MARLRKPPGAEIPPELLFPSSPVWRDRELFDAWMLENCRRQNVFEYDSARARYVAGLDAWVTTAELFDPRNPGRPDNARLRRYGIDTKRLREAG